MPFAVKLDLDDETAANLMGLLFVLQKRVGNLAGLFQWAVARYDYEIKAVDKGAKVILRFPDGREEEIETP